MKFLFLGYGVVSYLVFLASLLYAMAFVGNVPFAPRTIDVGPAASTGEALLIDALLLALFAVPHSIMARQGFKRAWTRIVPEPIERSTYVLVSSLLLGLLLWQWRPIPHEIWNVPPPAGHALVALQVLGWVVVLVSSFLIDHFDLFGLRQVWLQFRGVPYTTSPFKTPALYKLVRHPLLVGFIVAFWATPRMTAGHLLFAAATTAYSVIAALAFEERDLAAFHGEPYLEYKRRVRAFLPFPKR